MRKFDDQTLIKCDFFGRSVTQIFFSGNIFFWWLLNYTQSFSSLHCQKLPSSNILNWYKSVCNTKSMFTELVRDPSSNLKSMHDG